MRTIYLSPHLDDAVLSAGGLIRTQAEAGMPVEIWTFMAGSPAGSELPEFAQIMHRIWGFATVEQTIAVRRAEDLCAAAELGATAVHFDFLDCIYRRGQNGEPLYSDITLPIQPDDADLPVRIAHVIAARLQPADHLVCQLAVGRHVDHVIVRQAAELLHRPLFFDADVPYAMNYPGELAPAVSGFEESLEPVSELALQSWIRAIECYVSQIDSVFGSHDLMCERMHDYWSKSHGLRLWSIPSTR